MAVLEVYYLNAVKFNKDYVFKVEERKTWLHHRLVLIDGTHEYLLGKAKNERGLRKLLHKRDITCVNLHNKEDFLIIPRIKGFKSVRPDLAEKLVYDKDPKRFFKDRRNVFIFEEYQKVA